MDPVITDLLSQGGLVAILWAAVWYIARALRLQYETRIEGLEESAKRCEIDRQELHSRIEELYARMLEHEKKTRRGEFTTHENPHAHPPDAI